MGSKDFHDLGDERSLEFHIVFLRHFKVLEVGSHEFHVRRADLVSGREETMLEGMFCVGRIFGICKSVLMKLVGHVTVVLVKRTFDTRMDVEKVKVSASEIDAVKYFRR